jgi:putative ABC transport system permease protein
MFANYLKIALRNLIRLKGYTVVNIFGLALGLACCLLIVQYLRDEVSYDRHHRNGDDLYRVSTDFDLGDRQVRIGTTPPSLAAAIQQDFPEVVESARIFKAPGLEKFLFKVNGLSFFEEKGIYADSTFFRMLTYDFVAGDPAHALDEPFSIVLSTTLAEKLFPGQNALGQTLEIGSLWGEDLYTVKGVFHKDAYTTHIDGDFYISSMSGAVGRRFYRLEEWVGNNLFYTFIQLHRDADPKALEAKFPNWLEGYAGERLREMGFKKRHFLEPVERIYLYSDRGNLVGTAGDIKYVYMLASIALLILLIACINFMNLATAKATVRAREVGVRKVVGAGRRALLQQFLSEAFLYTSLAIILAYVLAEISMPLFNRLMGKNLQFDPLNDPAIWPVLIGFLLGATLIVGSYPALYLSSFNPVRIFRGGRVGNELSAKQVRKGLVVVQFIIAIALIQGVLVINEQMKYIMQKDLGFDFAHKIIVPLNSPTAAHNFTTLKNEFLRDSRVSAAGAASTYPGILNLEDMSMYGEGQSPEEGQQTDMTFVEPEYMHLMDFERLDGRLFSRERLADTLHSVVINETLAKGLGYDGQTAVGRRMFYDWNGEHFAYQIIGVIRDFHAQSLYQPIGGAAFFWDDDRAGAFLTVDVRAQDMNELLADLERAWASVNPEEPFQFYFLEDELQNNYAADRRTAGLIFWAMLFAILISCLGLLGLAAFAAERRTKEIGIRKILGASIGHIVTMLSRDFLGLVAVGFVIASPLAWYVMNRWLGDFHYHVRMPWQAYALAGALALVVALLTIFWQAWRAAKADPVRALRSE